MPKWHLTFAKEATYFTKVATYFCQSDNIRLPKRQFTLPKRQLTMPKWQLTSAKVAAYFCQSGNLLCQRGNLFWQRDNLRLQSGDRLVFQYWSGINSIKGCFFKDHCKSIALKELNSFEYPLFKHVSETKKRKNIKLRLSYIKFCFIVFEFGPWYCCFLYKHINSIPNSSPNITDINIL